MNTQPSSIMEPSSNPMHPTIGKSFLRLLFVLGLIYYAALVLDLIFHPSGAGVAVNGFSLGEATAERYIAVLIGTGTIVVGAFIMWRLPHNTVGFLMIIWGAGYTGYETLVDYGSPFLTSLAHLLFFLYNQGVAFPSLIILLLLFPTGQVYPRWAARWVALYVVLYVVGGVLSVMAQPPGPSVSNLGDVSLPLNPFFVPALAPSFSLINATVNTGLTGLGLVAAVVVLILRYRAARIRERQQIKWFVWITSFVVALAVIDLVVPSGPNNLLLSSPLVIAYLMFFYGFLGAAPAIAIGLAILRSRLWDIDVIINRTLMYSSLTALLALLYFGLIVGFQALVRVFTGQALTQSPVVIVVSTLAIAALFQPLRRRLQAIIDRRFYRQKYDAAKIAEAFSATLRSEVDFSQLSENLLGVVEQIMQPSSLSLWLCQHSRTETPLLQAGKSSPQEAGSPQEIIEQGK